VKVPVLVIQGEDDEYGTLVQVDAVCRKTSASSERLILPGVGHSPHRDAQDVVLSAMQRFIARLVD
jgi:pimeloyl-ACP methyl ester carboxylesterase